MNDIEIAWVAGLLEGEGCFRIGKQTKPLMDGSPAWRIDINMSSTDFDVIRKLQRITGIGRLYTEKTDYKLGKKPLLRWQLSKRYEAIELLRLIRPHMGERRGEKIDQILNHMEKNPFRAPIRTHLRKLA